MPFSKEKLDEILSKHVEWLALSGGDPNSPAGERADLKRCDLRNASLPLEILNNARFLFSNLQGAILCCADLQDAMFAYANLTGADLRGANLKLTNFWFANFHGANLKGVNFQEVEFIGASFQGADLQGAHLQEAYIWAGNDPAMIAQFPKANLRGADFKGGNLHKVNFHRATLQGANFQNANLLEANLQEADLRNAIFCGAKLNKANLLKADLRNSDLSDCILEDATLSHCQMQGANLYGAKIYIQQMLDARTWRGEPLNRNLVIMRNKEGTEILEPAVFLSYFHSYRAVASLLEQFAQLPAGDVVVKTVKGFDGQTEFQVSVFADSPSRVADLVETRLAPYFKKQEQQTGVFYNNILDILSDIAFSVETGSQSLNRLLESENKWTRQISATFKSQEEKLFQNLLKSLKDASTSNAEFNRYDASNIAAQIAEHLEKRFSSAQDDPTLISQLKEQALNFTSGVNGSLVAAGVASCFGSTGLIALSAAQLGTVLVNTIHKWWRKKERKSLLQEPCHKGPRLLPDDNLDTPPYYDGPFADFPEEPTDEG